jgi:hypothetical protein
MGVVCIGWHGIGVCMWSGGEAEIGCDSTFSWWGEGAGDWRMYVACVPTRTSQKLESFTLRRH